MKFNYKWIRLTALLEYIAAYQGISGEDENMYHLESLLIKLATLLFHGWIIVEASILI